MEPFPLLDLNNYTLEKTLRKFNPHSFRRLQQTSWEAQGTIQENSKISVFAEETFSLEYKGALQFQSTSYQGGLDPRGMYATRIGTLTMIGCKLPPFEDIYELLQKYRITCKNLLLLEFVGLTNDECHQLLDILKPEKLEMITVAFGRPSCNCLEALSSPTALLKDVTLTVQYSSCENAVSQLLTAYHRVKIDVAYFGDTKEIGYEIVEHLELLQRILNILLSQSKPKLEFFEFLMRWPRIVMFDPRDEEMEQYSVVVERNNEKIQDWLKMPENKFPSDSSCKADFSYFPYNRSYYASISFNNSAK